jgi:hypothetical protein
MPGEWRLIQIETRPEIERAADDVTAWGYPRPVIPREIELCQWFRMGKGLVFWFEPPCELEPGDARVHLAVAHRYRSAWPVRRWDYASQIVAELLGAQRMLFTPCPGDVRTGEYAVRLGWQRAGQSYVRNLGG